MYFKYQASCISRIGCIRDDNEDNFLFEGKSLDVGNTGMKNAVYSEGDTKEKRLFGLFDGMGGEEGGEIAASVAADVLRKKATNLETTVIPSSSFLNESAKEMNDEVFRKGKELGYERMGTTAAVLCVYLDRIHICNVGDTRVYRIKRNRITLISDDDVLESNNTKNCFLSQYIGVDSNEYTITPHIKKGRVSPNDIYVICSDGLYNSVPEKTIKDIVLKNKHELFLCSEKLVDCAEANGADDNCSVILVRFMANKSVFCLSKK